MQSGKKKRMNLKEKFEQLLEETDKEWDEQMKRLEAEGKIKRVQLWDDFEDATFVDTLLRKNNR